MRRTTERKGEGREKKHSSPHQPQLRKQVEGGGREATNISTDYSPRERQGKVDRESGGSCDVKGGKRTEGVGKDMGGLPGEVQRNQMACGCCIATMFKWEREKVGKGGKGWEKEKVQVE